MAATPGFSPQLDPRRKGAKAARRASLIGLLMLAVLCTRERTAFAEGPADEAPPRHVEIKMVAREEDRSLVAVLSELLERLQVTTSFSTVPDLETEEMWTPHPGSPAAIARAW